MTTIRKNAIRDQITRYWLAHYVNLAVGLCSLCGNTGRIDTRGTAVSQAGVSAGRVNLCLCPNGQALRARTKKKHAKKKADA